MHYSLWRAYQHTFLGDSGYRCQRCGKGPVIASDGFLMTSCLTCDNGYQSAAPIDLGISRIAETVSGWFRSLFGKAVPNSTKSGEHAAETGVL